MIKLIKQIGVYFIWVILALFLGFVSIEIYMHATGYPEDGMVATLTCFHGGLILGGIVALVFLIIDIFYLGKKLMNTIKSAIIRLRLLIALHLLAGLVYYVLDKVLRYI